MPLAYGFVKAKLVSPPVLKGSRHRQEIQYHLHFNLLVEGENWDVAVNVGTVVLGTTSKPKPNYFGLDVGQIPGTTGKPAAKDGSYPAVVLALDYGGKGYLTTGVTVVLSGNRTHGSFSGSALGSSAKVTGTFSC